jgi:hypothetical protein
MRNYCINVKPIIRILSVALIAAIPLLLKSSLSAAFSPSMSLTPSSATVAIGDTVNVNVYEDSGTQDVNGVQAHLSYNANIFDFISITSSPAFSTDTSGTGGGSGAVRIERGAFPAVTGNQLVGTVTLKAKAGGTSALSFDSASYVWPASGPQANTPIAVTGTNGSYTVPSPPPPPTPPPSPTPTPSPAPSPTPSPSKKPTSPSPSPKPSPSPTPTPSPTPSPSAADTTAPTISDVTVSDIGISSALISWKTSEPATSEVDYGITTNYELTNGNAIYVTDHKLNLNYKLLNPDTLFHFKVKSIDAAGNIANSQDQTFATKAGHAILAIKVVDQSNKAVEGAKLTIGQQRGTTDKNGHSTIGGLAPGKASVTINYNGKTTKKDIQIETPHGEAQNITLTIQRSKNYTAIILLPTLGLIVLAAGAYFLSGGLGGSKSFPGASSTDESIVVGGGAGSTTSPGGGVTPPEKETPVTQKNTHKADAKSQATPVDGKEAPPPTIVRPTIPPRS